MITTLHLDGVDLKMLRETLCFAQATVNQSVDARRYEHSDRISKVIAEIDRKRPLGPDGKHDNRHTEYCGCENIPRHFAPYGSSSAVCGFEVPKSTLRYSHIPDYASRLFTSRRSLTTCQKCVGKFV